MNAAVSPRERGTEMSENTAINPEIHNAASGGRTVLNPEIWGPGQAQLAAGTILGGKYRIDRLLSAETSEADVYVCSDGEREYAAKLYKGMRAVKPEVTAALKEIVSPFVAPLIDTGEYRGMLYEILPYYKNGSLQGKKFTMEELRQTIIPGVNEALCVLHRSGMLHKDLKPSNIMLCDDGKGIALIDFGISSVVRDGSTVLLTKTGMTPEYAAPETFRGLFLEESDYYSFGIAIYELFCGSTPYANMSADQIERFTAVQRLPYPKEMPKELQQLISALTYSDITNRHTKENPNRRWTYDEVRNWCAGKRQPIPGEGRNAAWSDRIPAYAFHGLEYRDLNALARALAEHWEEGKKQLFRGHLYSFFAPVDPQTAGHCIAAEEEAAHAAGRDDLIFWDLLYTIAPDLNGFHWKGRYFGSLPALGREMLDRLRAGDDSENGLWDGILERKLLSAFLERAQADDAALTGAVSALETAHALPGRSGREKQLDYYTMAYLLSGQKMLQIGERLIKSAGELTEFLREKLDSSYAEFEQICHSLIDYEGTLDVQLEAWLLSVGRRTELEAWRAQMAQ